MKHVSAHPFESGLGLKGEASDLVGESLRARGIRESFARDYDSLVDTRPVTFASESLNFWNANPPGSVATLKRDFDLVVPLVDRNQDVVFAKSARVLVTQPNRGVHAHVWIVGYANLDQANEPLKRLSGFVDRAHYITTVIFSLARVTPV